MYTIEPILRLIWFMNIIKSTGTFSFYTLISRISGYLRDILIAIFLGSGPIADAFFVAFRIPNTFRRLFGDCLLYTSPSPRD